MIELSDTDVLKMGRTLTGQYWEIIRLRQCIGSAENKIHVLLFCIFSFLVAIFWGPK